LYISDFHGIFTKNKLVVFSALNSLWTETNESQQITRQLSMRSTPCRLDSTVLCASSISYWLWYVSIAILNLRETTNECTLIVGPAQYAEDGEWIEIQDDVNGKRTLCACMRSERTGKYFLCSNFHHLSRSFDWTFSEDYGWIPLWHRDHYCDTFRHLSIIQMKVSLLVSWTLLAMYRGREWRSMPVRSLYLGLGQPWPLPLLREVIYSWSI
jgi:hypothetical protein